jgi:hypothetical protein
LLSQNKNYCIVDFNYYLYKDSYGCSGVGSDGILIKELVVLWPEYNTTHSFVFKLPQHYDKLASVENKRLNENVFHVMRVGIPLKSGEIEYSELRNVLSTAVSDASEIYVYGDKKSEYVRRLVGKQHSAVVNIKRWMEFVEVRKRMITVQQSMSDESEVSCFKLFCGKLRPIQKREHQQHLCVKHTRYNHNNECGILSNFSSLAYKEKCRHHLSNGNPTCSLKHGKLFALYIKSHKNGCRYNQQL